MEQLKFCCCQFAFQAATDLTNDFLPDDHGVTHTKYDQLS